MRPRSPGSGAECRGPRLGTALNAVALASRYKAAMVSLRFRAPGTELPLGVLLARALPFAREDALAGAVRGGQVRVDGRVERSPDRTVPPGARVGAELQLEEGPAPAARLRLRGEDFAVLETAPGCRPPRPDAATVLRHAVPALASQELEIVIEGDSDGAGLWLVAFGGLAASRLRHALSESGALESRALVPAPPWRRGALAADPGVLRFDVIAQRDAVAELQLLPGTLDPFATREALARAGAAVLGDARFGGRLVEGGLRLFVSRLRLPSEGLDVACDPPRPWWPDEPVFPAQAGRRGPGAELTVSQATLRAVARGHPWVLADTETGDAGRFGAGALVALRGPAGEFGGLARIEGEGPLAARIWTRATSEREGGSVEARVAAALERRSRLLAAADAPEGTNAFRLVHGEADGLPGLAIDRLGGCLRVLVTGRACAQVSERAVDAVVHALGGSIGPDPPVIEVVHLRERPPGALECVRLARGVLSKELVTQDARLVVREEGLLFEVELGLGDATRPAPTIGLFLDQRENRARLAARARGGRWLNLFAHTGAFTAALLRAGAEEVVSVDLSAAWLRRLEDTLARNGLDAARSRIVRGDSRRALERLPSEERFDGIVLDPPTAAAAGRRFWSVRRDLEPTVERCLALLAPGGSLLVCRNDRGGRPLVQLVRRAAAAAGVTLADLEPAPPGDDFPPLPGFPEGTPFEGLLARTTAEG